MKFHLNIYRSSVEITFENTFEAIRAKENNFQITKKF